uniref:Uncharacterized protein n=1 Tax=Fundulus heteroclitus TaxID=8078 RepID=A0A3Q2NPU5_FUNHE
MPLFYTLWEQAAAEVRSQESGAADWDGGEAVCERSVFLMGSKAGVGTALRRLHLQVSANKFSSSFSGENVHSAQMSGEVSGLCQPSAPNPALVFRMQTCYMLASLDKHTHTAKK